MGQDAAPAGPEALTSTVTQVVIATTARTDTSISTGPRLRRW
jgi:hypothetical protein